MFSGLAHAVQISTFEYEGHYIKGGNLSIEDKLTGDWTRTVTCCVLGAPDDSLNVVDANTPLLGQSAQLIGATGGPGQGLVTPGPPDFGGTVLSVVGVDAAGVTLEADFTGAANLEVAWQLVKLIIKQGGHREGIFVTTTLFAATDPIQRAFIPIGEFNEFLADSPGGGGLGVSHFTAFGVAGPSAQVPESATVLLLGLGFVAIAAYGRRQIRSARA